MLACLGTSTCGFSALPISGMTLGDDVEAKCPDAMLLRHGHGHS